MSWRSWSLVVALALVACSGSSADGTSTTAAPTPPSATTSVAVSSSMAPADTAAPTTVVTPTTPTTPTPPPTSAPTTTPSTAVTPRGFTTVAGRVTAADGATCDVCLWLAADPAQRAQGLMGVTDLGGADGMVFRWDEPTSGGFWMRDTPQPLSIAFFGADGAFVSAADMVPCLQPTPDPECARYGAAGPYRYAVEVASGGLGVLLMEQGSRLELLGTDCPLLAMR